MKVRSWRSFVQKFPKPSHRVQSQNPGLPIAHQTPHTQVLCYCSDLYATGSSCSSPVPFPPTLQVSPSSEVWQALCLECFSCGYLQDRVPVTSFRSLLKCHLLSGSLLWHPIKNATPHTPSPPPFPCILSLMLIAIYELYIMCILFILPVSSQ